MQFLGSTQPQNLAGMFNACTMGQLRLDASNSKAFNVPFPCQGNTSDGTKFGTTSCSADILNWQTYAAEYVANSLKVDISGFQHRCASNEVCPRLISDRSLF